MIITIDGPSGTGKSTVAKGVAKKLGFTFFDTGAMYRSLAWLILKEKIDPQNQAQVESVLPRFQYEIRQAAHGERHYYVNGTEVTNEIRTQAVSMAASQIAIYPGVREEMVKIQRRYGHAVDAVFEGRDMGTVVFPDADLKIFLTAKAEVRAERRYRELVHKFPDLSMSYDEILKEIKERDETDSTRAISPLKKASDATVIDTSDITAQQVIDKIVAMRPKRRYPKMKFSYKFVYWLARIFFKCCFRLKIYGLEHFRPGAGVIAANHSSFYDPPVLSISCPEEVHFLARGSLFEVPLLGWLIKGLNAHPVARGVSDAAIFRDMIELLQQGKKLILFPEGKRSETGQLLPLERGLSFLVQKSQCRVIPAYIHGAYDAWPRGRKFPKLFGKMTVVFGSPIEWEEGADKKDAQARITAQTEDAIRNLKEWLESGARGSPP
ncbi:MAG: (d)CMP kinase [Parachlamydiales bacterium]|nr:(d)CMP kinase [Parachlamydiales bacterium]